MIFIIKFIIIITIIIIIIITHHLAVLARGASHAMEPRPLRNEVWSGLGGGSRKLFFPPLAANIELNREAGFLLGGCGGGSLICWIVT